MWEVWDGVVQEVNHVGLISIRGTLCGPNLYEKYFVHDCFTKSILCKTVLQEVYCA